MIKEVYSSRVIFCFYDYLIEKHKNVFPRFSLKLRVKSIRGHQSTWFFLETGNKFQHHTSHLHIWPMSRSGKYYETRLWLQFFRCSCSKTFYDAHDLRSGREKFGKFSIFLFKKTFHDFCFVLTFFIEEKKMKNSCRTVLVFWFCFYAHDNYITLEKAKLLIIRSNIKSSRRKTKARKCWKCINE